MDFVATGKWGFALCREHLSPGCVDLMQRPNIRVYARPQELRLIEVSVSSSGWALFTKKAPKK